MPISLPTTESGSSGTNHGNGFSLAGLRSRFFPTLDFSSTPGRSVAAILTIRSLYNLLVLVLSMMGGGSGVIVATLFFLIDPLVMMCCLGLIAEAQGERKVLGTWIGRRQLDAFLLICAAIHALYAVYVLVCTISFAIFFGYGLGHFLTIVGLVISATAFLASRPPTDEDGTLGIA
ncbi:hypothetical protein MFIFM68171_10174 [Madurella fahalii]|uniref:Uncharacterized protein n=1 Tax=Madurella fahalii TaxID=1157608 RepID=A0ABQ0GQE1_9PEZI